MDVLVMNPVFEGAPELQTSQRDESKPARRKRPICIYVMSVLLVLLTASNVFLLFKVSGLPSQDGVTFELGRLRVDMNQLNISSSNLLSQLNNISLKTGPAGPQGPPGAQGPKGDNGTKGDPGVMGPEGPAGFNGTEGPEGPAGFNGTEGPPGVSGPTGPKGDKGDVGIAGPAGIPGPEGPAGFNGTEGPPGVSGPTGPKGDKGDVGIAGPAGIPAPAAELVTMETKANITEKLVQALIRDREVRKVAFSTSLWDSGPQGDTGPIKSRITLIFKHVFANIGNAYNPQTGIFTPPVRGAYHFDLHVYGTSTPYPRAELMKNDVRMCSASQYQPSGTSAASNGVTLLLEVADVVFVRLAWGYKIFDDRFRYTTFSGHLLFTM